MQHSPKQFVEFNPGLTISGEGHAPEELPPVPATRHDLLSTPLLVSYSLFTVEGIVRVVEGRIVQPEIDAVGRLGKGLACDSVDARAVGHVLLDQGLVGGRQGLDETGALFNERVAGRLAHGQRQQRRSRHGAVHVHGRAGKEHGRIVAAGWRVKLSPKKQKKIRIKMGWGGGQNKQETVRSRRVGSALRKRRCRVCQCWRRRGRTLTSRARRARCSSTRRSLERLGSRRTTGVRRTVRVRMRQRHSPGGPPRRWCHGQAASFCLMSIGIKKKSEKGTQTTRVPARHNFETLLVRSTQTSKRKSEQ